MKNIKFITTILLLSGIMITTHAIAGGNKKSCTLKVRHCLTESDMVFSIYNGNDTAHAIPANFERDVPKGQDKTLTCNWDNCDVQISVASSSNYWKNDVCNDVTFKADKTFVDGLVLCN